MSRLNAKKEYVQPKLTERQKRATRAIIHAIRAGRAATEALEELRDSAAPMTRADWGRLLIDNSWIKQTCLGGLYALGCILQDLECGLDAGTMQAAGLMGGTEYGPALLKELGMQGKAAAAL